jgi:hypothetical protein
MKFLVSTREIASTAISVVICFKDYSNAVMCSNSLTLFKVHSFSYLLLHVSVSSVPSSGNLHLPTESLVPSESLLIKFCTMDGDGF